MLFDLTIGRKGVTFNPELGVREFSKNPMVTSRANYTLPAATVGPKEKPGNNWNTIVARGIVKRPNGKKQSQPYVPRLAANNARRIIAPVYSEEENAVMAKPVPLGPPVIGASNASLWSKPKGGRRVTRKRLSRKRS